MKMALKEDDEIVIKELTYFDENEEEEIETEATDILKAIDCSVTGCTTIIEDGFGIYKNEDGGDDFQVIHRYTFINRHDITVQVITYGGTIVSIKTPDKYGHVNDIVLGFDDLKSYRSDKNPYFGATVGRITGIIPQYVFSIAGQDYFITKNFKDSHHVNGGIVGFDKVIWNANISDGKLFLSYVSHDQEEGFPGHIVINRSYELNDNNELIIETSAHCSKPTPIDISTHVDWNLSSHVGGSKELYKHYLMLNADRYAQVNKERILTGKLKNVNRTVFDLRIPRPLGRIIHRVPGGGFDHYMHIIRGSNKHNITFAAKLIHPDSGRFVEVITDQPGIFVYTQNNLYAEHCIIEAHPISCWCRDTFLIMEQKKIHNPADKNNPPSDPAVSNKPANPCSKRPETYGPLHGKLGASYRRHGGIRLVPANYPEPVSRQYQLDTFLIYPGQTYVNTTIYKFGNTFNKAYDPLNQCHWENTYL